MKTIQKITFAFITATFFAINSQAQVSDFGNIDFHKADSIAKSLQGETLQFLPIVSHKLTSELETDVEKFRAIYTWVCLNIENDYYAFAKNKKKRNKLKNNETALEEWNNSFKARTFKILREKKKTVCTGYAYLVSELADFADIECKIVDGYGRTAHSNIGEIGIPNHSWNVVKLNEKWYLCDATWSSGFFNMAENSFVKDYHDGYFLAEPALFAMNHYPLDTTWLLLDNKPSINTFATAPLIYKDAFNYQLLPIAPETMKTEVIKNQETTFSFKVSEDFQSEGLKIDITYGSRSQIVEPTIKRASPELLLVSYAFQRVGSYDIHFKMEGEPLATYTVKVRKD